MAKKTVPGDTPAVSLKEPLTKAFDELERAIGRAHGAIQANDVLVIGALDTMHGNLPPITVSERDALLFMSGEIARLIEDVEKAMDVATDQLNAREAASSPSETRVALLGEVR